MATSSSKSGASGHSAWQPAYDAAIAEGFSESVAILTADKVVHSQQEGLYLSQGYSPTIAKQLADRDVPQQGLYDPAAARSTATSSTASSYSGGESPQTETGADGGAAYRRHLLAADVIGSTATSSTASSYSGGESPQTETGADSGYNIDEFVRAVLEGIGAPATPGNVAALLSWAAGENTTAANNPLATTQGRGDPGRYGNPTIFNSHGVKNYPDFETGVRATVDTLNLSHYRDIVTVLKRGTDANELERFVVESPWGTKTFGDAQPAVTVGRLRALVDQQRGVGPGDTVWPEGNPAEDDDRVRTASPVPAGYQAFNVDGQQYIVYELDGGMGVSAYLYFRHDTSLPGGTISAADWAERSADWADAGASTVLSQDPDMMGRTWENIAENFLYESSAYGTDALADPTYMAALAEYLASPDMEPNALEELIRRTDWWDSRTDRHRIFSNLSEAEQSQQILDQAQGLLTLWEYYTGETIDWMGYDEQGLPRRSVVSIDELQRFNPSLYEWATKVADGTSTQQTAVNTWVKPAAAEIENSPHNRRIEEETIAAGRRGVDVATNRGSVVDLYNRFGLDVSESEAARVAEQLYMNETSLEDVEGTVKDASQAVWVNKPRDVDWETWASPYTMAYSNVLETTRPDFRDSAMTTHLGGAEMPNLADFKQGLRGLDSWQYTDNAKESYATTFGTIGRMMGFS